MEACMIIIYVWQGKGSEVCTLGVQSVEPLPWNIIIICVWGRVRVRNHVHSVYSPSNPYPGIYYNLCVWQGKGSETYTLGVQSVEPLPWNIIIICVCQGKGSEPCTLGVQAVEPLPWNVIIIVCV